MTGERDALAQVLVACATTTGEPIDDGLVVAAGTELERLPLACERHGLSMCAHVALRDAPLPDAVRELLAARHRYSMMRHLLLSSELGRLGAVLDDAGLTWVVVKGPAVSDRLYPRPDLRPYIDIDLLVERSQFRDALVALSADGGELLERDWAEVLRLFKGELNLALPTGVVADLHWSLLYDEALRQQFRWDDATLLARRVHVPIGASPALPTLDAVDTLLHLAVHACLAGGQRLIWMRDVQLAGRQPHLDWSVVKERAHEFEVGLPVGAMLRRTRRVLGQVPWPEELEDALLGGSRWPDVLRLVDLARPPARWVGGLLSGHVVLGSTRPSTRASLTQLMRRARDEVDEIRRNEAHPWRQRMPKAVSTRVALPTRAPPSANERFRAAYFDAVAPSSSATTSR